MEATNRIYCYIFVGGKLVQQNNGEWEYVGGRSKGIHIYKGMPFQQFTDKVLEKFNIPLHVLKMCYTLKFNPKVVQDLEDDDDLDNVVSHSDDFANVYIVDSHCVEVVEAVLPNPQLEPRCPTITFPSSNASCNATRDGMMSTRGFASRCAETEYITPDSSRLRDAILGSGHTFKNAEENLQQVIIRKKLKQDSNFGHRLWHVLLGSATRRY